MKRRLDTDETNFRRFMRTVPSPVVVITAAGRTGNRGFTVGSFCSVSLDPLLVSFNVSRSSRMHGVLSCARRFAVHLLSASQDGLADHFSKPGLSQSEQFDQVQYRYTEDGLPLLDAVDGILLCTVVNRIQAGDHDIVIGRVQEIDIETDLHPPLVYHDRKYTTVRDSGQA